MPNTIANISESDIAKLRVQAHAIGEKLAIRVTEIRLYSTSSPGVKMVVWADSEARLYGYGDLETWEPSPVNVLEVAIEF